ncbi:MAG: hypothetical protein V3T70_06185 [Phycisphaerae bacterium]
MKSSEAERTCNTPTDGPDSRPSRLAAQTCCQAVGLPWMRYKGMLTPALAPHRSRDVSQRDIARAIKAQRVFGAMWTFDWDCESAPYYYVVCSDPAYDVERIPNAQARRNTRLGLRRSELELVSAEWVADHCYGVYQAAFERYGNAAAESHAAFRATALETAGFSDWWVARSDSRPIAFAEVFFDGDAAFIGHIKFDYAERNKYPMNALEFTLGRHYVVERGFRYLSGGPLNVYHKTSVHDFRLRLGWRKAYCRLGVCWNMSIRSALRLRLDRIVQVVAPAGWRRKLETVQRMSQLADACRTGPWSQDGPRRMDAPAGHSSASNQSSPRPPT